MDVIRRICRLSIEMWLQSRGDGGPTGLAVWTLDKRMNHCAALLGYVTPLLSPSPADSPEK